MTNEPTAVTAARERTAAGTATDHDRKRIDRWENPTTRTGPSAPPDTQLRPGHPYAIDRRHWRSVAAPPPADERAVIAATEQRDQLHTDLAHEGKRAAAALANARLWADTGVRAAGNRTGGPSLYCDTHDRNLTRCLEDHLDCTGSYRTRSDPAGETATELTSDQARADHAEILRLLADLPRLATLISRYETRPGSGASLPDIDWCRSCYRDDRHHQPIERRADGSPFYAKACRWCGAFKGEHGIDPPVELLRARHLGQRITTRMVDDALAKARDQARNRR